MQLYVLNSFHWLMVRKFQKDFLVSSNSPKKQMNEFVVVVNTNLFIHFLGEFEDTKSPFEIIWPLDGAEFWIRIQWPKVLKKVSHW